MKRIAVTVLLLTPILALADSNPDHSFYRKAAMGGIAEVEMGRLAEDKASSPEVKEFAVMMVRDHTAANQQLEQLAASKQINLPKGPGTKARAEKVKLEAMSGAHFDKDYIADQVKAHEQTQALLQQEIASGQDADAKAFAQKILTTVQQHLAKAQQLAGGTSTAQR